MSRLKSIFRNLRSLLTDDLVERSQSHDARAEELLRLIEAQEGHFREELGSTASRVDARSDAYEAAVDARIAARLDVFETRLSEYQSAVDARIDERLGTLERRLDQYQAAVDSRIDERLATSEKALDSRFAEHQKLADSRADEFEGMLSSRIDEFKTALTSRLNSFEEALTTRTNEYESTTNQRLENYETTLDTRIEARLAQLDESLGKRLTAGEAKLEAHAAETLKRVDLHFDKRNLATDNRLDDRLAHIERHIDARFDILEKRSDDRMETHERTVDGKLHQRSQDIVDRNDLMLQIFDQQLDKFRRQLRAVESHLLPATGASTEPGAEREAKSGGRDAASGSLTSESNGEPPHQLVSFRKLAETSAQKLRRIGSGAPPLYHQILSWKKVAHEGLNDFAPDEMEMVNYILSFISDPKEIAYVRQHLRRFVSTIERVPAMEHPGDRILELGSLGHLAPAIKKYCGYTEVFCGDSWEGEERVRIETLRQTNGPDTHSFELRNFNVEADTFPYPDGYFRTVLCCELIEHLQRDPLHMLWECNRVLADNGHLLLTTPNIASTRAIEGLLVGCTPYLFPQYNLKEVADQHNREYAPYEIGIALAAAGFSVVALETEDVWLRSNPAVIELLKEIQISAELRGDNIFALARKVSAPIERYPAELYTDR